MIRREAGAELLRRWRRGAGGGARQRGVPVCDTGVCGTRPAAGGTCEHGRRARGVCVRDTAAAGACWKGSVEGDGFPVGRAWCRRRGFRTLRDRGSRASLADCGHRLLVVAGVGDGEALRRFLVLGFGQVDVRRVRRLQARWVLACRSVVEAALDRVILCRIAADADRGLDVVAVFRDHADGRSSRDTHCSERQRTLERGLDG